MSILGRFKTAMEAIGPPVYAFVAPFDGNFPHDYIVINIVQDRPELYAGDEDVAGEVQVRASWYSSRGNLGHSSQMRKAAKAAGFTVKGGFSSYDHSIKHCVQHEEFWTESEDE